MNKKIGWTDESSPHSIGYRIMTEDGIRVYDMDDHIEYEKEKERVQKWKANL